MKEKVKFAFHILTHPFDGFYDMKREKKGSLAMALLLFLLTIVTQILSKQMMAFLFNPDKFAPFDVIFEINKLLILFVVFCIANWSVTTLMQGEGTFKDIVMTTGYACLPMVLIPLPVAIISNIAAYTEEIYLTTANTVAVIWFGMLLFIGIMTVHQYSLSRMVGTTVVTVVAMMAIIFICLLFFNLFSQLLVLFFLFIRKLHSGPDIGNLWNQAVERYG